MTGAKAFDRGVVMLSLDTEQIWGHLDRLTEWQYHRRYPDTPGAYDRLLTSLIQARISATWFVVGGLAMESCDGAEDDRLAGLPEYWRRFLPAGSEATKPVWYRPSFLQRLAAAAPRQEIGLHGGLTHFVWTDTRGTADTIRWELARGLDELQKAGFRASSFSFPRDQEGHHRLLRAQGIRCYRGRTPARSYQLGRTLSGAVLRALEQWSGTPPLVWPEEALPGLWNLPSSDFLYPIGLWRTRAVPLRARVERLQKGIDAAARHRQIFHFCFHPANLSESPDGFVLLEQMLERMVRAKKSGDVEILTMTEVIDRLASDAEQSEFESLKARV